MLDNLKNEMNNFLKDLDNNIKDKDDLECVKLKLTELLEKMINYIGQLQNYENDTLNEILKKQEQEEAKILELQKRLDYVYQDIYEDEDSFIINCPYCNAEFDAFVDEDLTEIKCPECSNVIELDWSGNIDDDDDEGGCGGNCSHCNGCK